MTDAGCPFDILHSASLSSWNFKSHEMETPFASPNTEKSNLRTRPGVIFLKKKAKSFVPVIFPYRNSRGAPGTGTRISAPCKRGVIFHPLNHGGTRFQGDYPVGLSTVVGRRTVGVWIGGVWNGHFPEFAIYLSEAEMCRKITEIPHWF